MKTLKRVLLGALVTQILATGQATAQAEIFDAWLRGDSRLAVEYIEAGHDPSIRDKEGRTLLHWAAWTGEIEIARSLLDKGLDVDIEVEPGGTTALMQASMRGHHEMVKMLLDEGADPRATVPRGDNALHFAASAKPPNPIVFAALLSAGADINGVSEANSTVLHRAATESDHVLLNILLDAGADPTVQMEVDKDADPARQAYDGFRPLDFLRKHNARLLKTDAGRRLQRLTYEGTGCEGVIVLPGDKKLTILAERTLGKASRWKQIAELNGLGPDKSYRLGDCLKLPE